METNKYDTLHEAVDNLTKRGYIEDFKVENDNLIGLKNKGKFNSQDLKIVEHHRFEGDSNPSDMSIVYAIEAEDGTKGTFVDAFGAYEDKASAEFIKKILEE